MHTQEVLVSGRACMYVCIYVCMYVCMSVTGIRFEYTSYIWFTNFLARSALRFTSAATVVVRWRTQGTEDDDWLGSELRGTEDD